MSKQISCPKCGGTQIQVLGNDRKAFSVGKAALGGLLVGGVGVIAGFYGKKGKYEVFCQECGYRWKIK